MDSIYTIPLSEPSHCKLSFMVKTGSSVLFSGVFIDILMSCNGAQTRDVYFFHLLQSLHRVHHNSHHNSLEECIVQATIAYSSNHATTTTTLVIHENNLPIYKRPVKSHNFTLSILRPQK